MSRSGFNTVIALLVTALYLMPAAAVEQRVAGDFADNPIVYFVITDRFYNGSDSNDNAYGRMPDGKDEIGTFHGGDIAGLTQILEQGYFEKLGVNALWITPVYEQIHGWVVGGNRDFRHYAYHGYYALDFTRMDKSMGSGADLRKFVNTAHAQGIRIIMDVVMNHPGYADIKTMSDLGIDVLWSGYEQAVLENYHSFFDYNSFEFTNWWGGDWVRADLPGYMSGNQYDERLMQLAYLPDFRTESEEIVELPPVLKNKKDTSAKHYENYTVREYLTDWLAKWVEDYGIDGFRCDTAKHVDLESWQMLKHKASTAYEKWKSNHPDNKIDDQPFWMVAEVFPHGVEETAYFDFGFDNVINFDLQARITDPAQWENIYSQYAEKLSGPGGYNVLSFISSHDTHLYDRDNLTNGATGLLLVPGGVQIFYGDESARPNGPAPIADKQQATRSDMNWDSLDQSLLQHWQKLTNFRKNHVAIAQGRHKKIQDEPYAFSRSTPTDKVIVAIDVSRGDELDVSDLFADGETVFDYYSQKVYPVNEKKIRFDADSEIVLLEHKF